MQPLHWDKPNNVLHYKNFLPNDDILVVGKSVMIYPRKSWGPYAHRSIVSMSPKNIAFSCIHFMMGSNCKWSVEIFFIIFLLNEVCETFNSNPRQSWILPILDQLTWIERAFMRILNFFTQIWCGRMERGSILQSGFPRLVYNDGGFVFLDTYADTYPFRKLQQHELVFM